MQMLHVINNLHDFLHYSSERLYQERREEGKRSVTGGSSKNTWKKMKKRKLDWLIQKDYIWTVKKKKKKLIWVYVARQ